jgi:pyruvate dehydrogenase E1 component beta subunit
MRQLTYAQSLSEALVQAMQRDRRIIVMGLGVDTPTGVFGTTSDAASRFPARVMGTPIAENAMTGIALGSAAAGMKTMLVHQRMDFMLMSMDQIANHVAKWAFMTGGKSKPTVVIRAVIGHAVGGGWGQASQHAQSLEALYAYIPGLRVVMPFTAADAKGMLMEALGHCGPTVLLDHRLLHATKGNVPQRAFATPPGKAAVRRRGSHITVVATSAANLPVRQASEICARRGVQVEWIDLRSVKPWDQRTVLASTSKTRRLLTVDTGPRAFGVGAEIIASVAERMGGKLRAVRRLGLPDMPVPAGHLAEARYYPGVADVIEAIGDMCGIKMPSRPSMPDDGKKTITGYRSAF